MKDALEFITLGAEVRRYHTVATVHEETVGHHSHGVALLCLQLDPQASRELLYAALVHDLAEQHTGDIPSPTKRSLELSGMLDKLESSLIFAHLGARPELSPAEQRTLKLADIAQGALKCVREIELGNARMRAVYDRYMAYADNMNLGGRELELFNTIKEIAK